MVILPQCYLFYSLSLNWIAKNLLIGFNESTIQQNHCFSVLFLIPLKTWFMICQRSTLPQSYTGHIQFLWILFLIFKSLFVVIKLDYTFDSYHTSCHISFVFYLGYKPWWIWCILANNSVFCMYLASGERLSLILVLERYLIMAPVNTILPQNNKCSLQLWI